MAVTLMPVSGMFRHPVDGAHAAHVLRERGFSSVAIRPIAEMRHAGHKDTTRYWAIAGACVVLLAVPLSGWFIGATIDKVLGAIAAVSMVLFALLVVLVVLNRPSKRVERYPRRSGVLLTVHCRTEDEPAVADALRDNGAVEVKLPHHP